jgi:hypothetical protein
MPTNQSFALDLCARARNFILKGDHRTAESLLRQAIGTDMACFTAYDYLEYILDAREDYVEATRLHYFMRFVKLGMALYPFLQSDVFDPAAEFAEIMLDEGFAEKIFRNRK